MDFDMQKALFFFLGITLVSYTLPAEACNFGVEGNSNVGLGRYNPVTGNQATFSLRISCANNKIVTLQFSSNNQCNLVRQNSRIPYDIYVGSRTRNYCNSSQYSHRGSQQLLVTLFARPINTSLVGGSYQDRVNIRLTF